MIEKQYMFLNYKTIYMKTEKKIIQGPDALLVMCGQTGKRTPAPHCG